jgi:hypothetical protein
MPNASANRRKVFIAFYATQTTATRRAHSRNRNSNKSHAGTTKNKRCEEGLLTGRGNIESNSMLILPWIENVAAGLFLCNCIPHLCSGLRGESFPSPFAKPPGVGKSSALTNTLWGSFNLIIGFLFLHLSPIQPAFNLESLLFLVGFVGIGLPLSVHFAKVRKS